MHPYVFLKPLTHHGRYVVDAMGSRVKLVCASWPAHLDSKLPEALHQQSIQNLALLVKNHSLSCVRFTYSVDYTLAPDIKGWEAALILPNLTITKIKKHNPGLLDLSLTEIYLKVVRELHKHNIMVIMDNHVSNASWCCAPFGDHNAWWNNSPIRVIIF
jgi:endoglucanase